MKIEIEKKSTEYSNNKTTNEFLMTMCLFVTQCIDNIEAKFKKPGDHIKALQQELNEYYVPYVGIYVNEEFKQYAIEQLEKLSLIAQLITPKID